MRKSHPLLSLHRLAFLRPPPLSPPLQAHRDTHLPNYSKPRSLTTPTCSKLARPIFEITSLVPNSQPKLSPSSIDGSSMWSGLYHSPATSALYEGMCSVSESRGDTDTGTEGELGCKTPSESRISILYKFSSDLVLREQYRNPWNRMRIGKLLVDLDALATTVSLKHCNSDDGTRKPQLLVTASVDKMVLRKPILVDADVNIVGSVTWVGRSSLEIQLQVSQPTKDSSDPLALVTNFTFVALNSEMDKSVQINRILPETEKEKLLWQEAEKRNKTWKEKKRAECKTDTSTKDINRLQTLLSKGRIGLADRDSILIRDTCLENSFMCQPQQRNVCGRIFGGFLMQKAFELAFSTTYAFVGVAPQFVAIDHVDFLKPVDVGDFLRLKSCVMYTDLESPDKPMINVEVVAHVTKPDLRSSEVSNKFYFRFTVPPEAMRNGLRIRNVVPDTEEEGRRVLEQMDDQGKQELLGSR